MRKIENIYKKWMVGLFLLFLGSFLFSYAISMVFGFNIIEKLFDSSDGKAQVLTTSSIKPTIEPTKTPVKIKIVTENLIITPIPIVTFRPIKTQIINKTYKPVIKKNQTSIPNFTNTIEPTTITIDPTSIPSLSPTVLPTFEPTISVETTP